MGLEPVDAGSIIVRGQDVAKASAGDRNIGYVPQSFALYPHYSVQENIEYPLVLSKASEATKKESVDRVAELLRIKDLLGKKPEQLSGGQKQRLSIARAVLKNPPIMILDEATSALDTQSEKQVQEALNRLMKGRTSVVIAHRLSTIKDCDQIMVLEKGQVMEQGTHDVLISNPNGFYRKMLSMQNVMDQNIDAHV